MKTHMTLRLCRFCVKAQPTTDHLQPGDKVIVVSEDECPRCAAETVTLSPLGKAAVAARKDVA